jgi:hypothetical protein
MPTFELAFPHKKKLPQAYADAAAQARWTALAERYRAVYGIPVLPQ